MGTLLFLVGLAATIVGLCVTVYGVSHGETKTIAIGRVFVFIHVSLVGVILWLHFYYFYVLLRQLSVYSR